MWRLWTKGWGVRDWWFWFKGEGLPMWCAWHLPRRVALWTFIRVYAWDGQSPGPEYTRVYNAWEAGEAGRYHPIEHALGSLGTLPSNPTQGAQQAESVSIPLQWGEAVYVGPPVVSGLGYRHDQRRSPAPIDLADPRFDILWNRLKHLDITGNDIATLLDELDAAPTLGV